MWVKRKESEARDETYDTGYQTHLRFAPICAAPYWRGCMKDASLHMLFVDDNQGDLDRVREALEENDFALQSAS